MKVSTKVGNTVGGPSKVQGEVTRFPLAVDSAMSAVESTARSAAASAAALQNLRSVGRDVVVSLRLMTYLVARLVEQGAAPLPRWLREDVLQVGEDPIADWIAEEIAQGEEARDEEWEGSEEECDEDADREFLEELDKELEDEGGVASVRRSSLRTGKRPELDRTGPEKNRTAVLVFDI